MGRDEGRRFWLHHRAAGGQARACVLYLHPLAEEMNRSRRMAALQARALAGAGLEVLQIDLHGCGDSAGDFGDASWQGWLDDALAAARWLRERHAHAPLWLWGLRAGALLAADAARALDAPCNLLLWQPAASGRLALQQFLRLGMAAQLADGHAGGGAMTALRQQLAAGEPVEIAGFALALALAAGLEGATLAPPPRAGRLAWLELGHGAAPAAGAALESWRQAGWQVQHGRVAGPAFWHTAEVQTAPALLDATVQALHA